MYDINFLGFFAIFRTCCIIIRIEVEGLVMHMSVDGR